MLDGMRKEDLYNLKKRNTLVEIEREFRKGTKTELYIFQEYTQLGFHVIGKTGVHKTFKWKEYALSWVVKSANKAFDFGDWGHYGIYSEPDALYDNGEELQMFLTSGLEFDSYWHGFKKEIQSMRVQRVFDEGVIVSVYAEMDDAMEQCDLICDCLNDAEERMLTDDKIEEIRNLLMEDMEFSSEEELSETISINASLEDVLSKATELMDICSNKLHESYLSCMAITLDVLYDYPEDKSFIYERIEKARKAR